MSTSDSASVDSADARPSIFSGEFEGGDRYRATQPRGHLNRRPVDRNQLEWVTVLVVLAAVTAVFTSSAAPTNTALVDAVERAFAAGLVTAAASRSRRWTLVVGAVAVTVGSPWPQMMLGLPALFGTVFMVETRRRDRVLAALIGAVIGVLSLRLEVPGPAGVETVIALVATVPILVSGYRRSSRAARSITRRSLTGALVLVVLTTALAAIAGALSVGHLNEAVVRTEKAVDLAGKGTGEKSSEAFTKANSSFVAAQATVGAIWASGARLVPVVGANLAATQRAVAAGVGLTDAGASLVSGAEFDSVQLDGGGVDLVALSKFAPRVRAASDALATATDRIRGAGSTWLLPPLKTRLDKVQARLGTVRRNSENATVAVGGLPALLGANGSRRYLFLFGNPAESRDMGGHIGNWAELVADNGRIDLVQVGRPGELSMPELSKEFAERYPASFTSMDPARFPQNLGATPDLPLSAEVAAELFEAKTGRAVDGVAYADVDAFAAMLELVGDVTLLGPSAPVVLNGGNAVEFVAHGQYELFASEDAAGDALDSVIQTTFDRLTNTKLPGPEPLGALFGPLVAQGRFQLYSLHRGDTAMLEHFGLDGAVPDPDGSDILGVFNRNVGPNKLDWYLERDVTTEIAWDPTTGSVGSTVTVDVHNGAPIGLTNELIGGNTTAAPTGTNVTEVVVLSPFRLQSLSVDGIETASQPLRERDLWRYGVRIAVPPQETVSIQYRLAGQVTAGPDYRLHYVGQPLVHDGELSVNLDALKGRIVSMTTRRGSASTHARGRSNFGTSQAADAGVLWRVEDTS